MECGIAYFFQSLHKLKELADKVNKTRHICDAANLSRDKKQAVHQLPHQALSALIANLVRQGFMLGDTHAVSWCPVGIHGHDCSCLTGICCLQDQLRVLTSPLRLMIDGSRSLEGLSAADIRKLHVANILRRILHPHRLSEVGLQNYFKHYNTNFITIILNAPACLEFHS